MAHRTVTRSGKDRYGDITALCERTASWSPRRKADAIWDIENGVHRYFVHGRTEVHVVNGPGGKYLRTAPNNVNGDNLDNLPDC